MKIILMILLCTAAVLCASDTVTTASGLKYLVIEKGSGQMAEVEQKCGSPLYRLSD